MLPLSFPQAAAAPRVHPSFDSAYAFSGIELETSGPNGWSEQQIEKIRTMGLAVTPIPRLGSFGRVHGIRFVAESGFWVGVADPDSEGAVYGPRR